MLTSIEPKAGSWILLVGPRSLNSTMLTAIARLPAPVPQAQVGERCSLRVLDGGNRFNAYTVARAARGLSPFSGGRPEAPSRDIRGILNRITVSRAFTCYQVLSLLESTPSTQAPFVVLDLLNTFYDESVQIGERKRLLRSCIAHLERLERFAGGVVSVHPPAVPSQAAIELLSLLQASAVDTFFAQPAASALEPMRLF